MAIFGRAIVILSFIVMLFMPIACGNDDDDTDNDPEPLTTSRVEPVEELPQETVITIGSISDLTGASAAAMATIDMALEDLVKHYNEENVIPGVELRIITYDEQSDPSSDIPGYELLKEKGAHLFFTGIGSVAQSLRSRLEDDKMVLFTVDANEEELSPPGYIFCLSNLPREAGYTLLQWIAENDWDYQTKGPAKIGGAGWFFPYVESLIGGMEEYCDLRPDQFEWVGGYLNPLGTFTWSPEVEALGDCDYVVPPVILTTFVKEYRNAGYTAKFACVDAHSAFVGQISDANLWDEIDGTLFLRTSRWWNEEGPVIDRTKQLLYEYHLGDAERIIRNGAPYLVVAQVDPMFKIIAKAVEAVGPENFDSRALRDAAESFSTNLDGLVFSFDENKRAAVDSLAMYEAVGPEEDLFRVDPEWYPIVRQP